MNFKRRAVTFYYGGWISFNDMFTKQQNFLQASKWKLP